MVAMSSARLGGSVSARGSPATPSRETRKNEERRPRPQSGTRLANRQSRYQKASRRLFGEGSGVRRRWAGARTRVCAPNRALVDLR